VPHGALVAALLALTGVLAVTSLVQDSPTFDETAHIAAGLAVLQTGDFRLSPEHPPLGKMWCTWPLLLVPNHWPPPDDEFWRRGDLFGFARHWLYELNDDPQRLVVISRCMMVVLLLATCLAIYVLGRTLFGSRAALLALTIAALSPTLLAHGRLVTTDLPITLCTTLTLLTFGRLLERITWTRLLLAGLALAAASLTKLSWPLVLPALALMAAVSIFGRVPLVMAARGLPAWTAALTADPAAKRWRSCAAVVIPASLVVLLVVWLGIWTCYRWRNSITAPLPPGQDTPAARVQLEQTQKSMSAWREAIYQPDGSPQPGASATIIRVLYEHSLLPEPYLTGVALATVTTGAHDSYLLGKCSTTGRPLYFLIAFLIKTPVPTLLLLAAGIFALSRRRLTPGAPVLLVGVVAFALVYLVYAVNVGINIGHRHLLPIYPLVYVFAGAAVAWATTRVGAWFLGAALVWLLGANVWIYPHYLSYFNELVGGPARGHLYLVDSNLDWGQDLLRLAKYAGAHPAERIKLAYFGSVPPTRYLRCEALPSFHEFRPAAELCAGTYVVSLTQLVGVYDEYLRDEFWTDEARQAYHDVGLIAASAPRAGEPAELRAQRALAQAEYPEWRARRLVNRLAHRRPDQRVGYSMYVYRLSDAAAAELTRP
jgi:4-amino-4-deoxy-L-arabinose transferase-like glycosyltransferase